jgi:RNA polymerase sigma-70 factor, ECF subfamily
MRSIMKEDIQYIWNDLHQELKKFIYAKVKNTPIADDILQEVFIKIHIHIHQLKDPGKLTSWVYQITRNTIQDFFKKNTFPSGIELAQLSGTEKDDDIYRSLSNCINSKIAKLSPTDQEAVLLTYFANYSQKELADFLGISYSGAKNRVQRAREKLRKSILACENVEIDSKGNPTDFSGE